MIKMEMLFVMNNTIIKASGMNGISDHELYEALVHSIEDKKDGLKKVLLLPPDMTRMYSGANMITKIYYDLLKDHCKVDIMPALGTHEPMTENEIRDFFGEDIPLECFIAHRWREDVVKIG